MKAILPCSHPNFFYHVEIMREINCRALDLGKPVSSKKAGSFFSISCREYNNWPAKEIHHAESLVEAYQYLKVHEYGECDC